MSEKFDLIDNLIKKYVYEWLNEKFQEFRKYFEEKVKTKIRT